MIKDRLLKLAFTLTEVLIALGIVGVIAVLVIPSIVSHFNERSLGIAENRAQNEIEEALKQYLLTTGATSIDRTPMYSYNEPSDYSSSSLAFINSYLKVNKTCNKDNASSCFANKYYHYSDGDKKVYTPSYKGYCAILKSGASLCITPKTHEHDVQVLMDTNGKKGPNVYGRDLIEFNIAMAGDKSKDTTLANVKSNQVKIDLKDPCENIPDSNTELLEACCVRNFESTLKSRCCGLPGYSSRPECDAQCSDSDLNSNGFKKACCIQSDEYYAGKHSSACCAAYKKDPDKFDKGICCSLPGYKNGNHPQCPPAPEPLPDVTITVTTAMLSTVWSNGNKTRTDKYRVSFNTVPSVSNVKLRVAHCKNRYPSGYRPTGSTFIYDSACYAYDGEIREISAGSDYTFDVKSTGIRPKSPGAGIYTVLLVAPGTNEYYTGASTYYIGSKTSKYKYNPNTKQFSVSY